MGVTLKMRSWMFVHSIMLKIITFEENKHQQKQCIKDAYLFIYLFALLVIEPFILLLSGSCF